MAPYSYTDYQRGNYPRAKSGSSRTADSPFVQRHLEEMIGACGLNLADDILEVGAGLGRFTLELKAKGLKVVAADPSPDLIDSLLRASPDTEALVCDVLDLPPDFDRRFDKVIGFFMLHRLADLPAAFRVISRALKPGGRVAFCEPNAYFLPYYLRILASPSMSFRGDGGVTRMRPSVLFSAMRAAGLEELEVASFGLFPPALANRWVARRAEQRLESLPIPDSMRAFRIFKGRAAAKTPTSQS
jgi:SAM-dependent methyltransferase